MLTMWQWGSGTPVAGAFQPVHLFRYEYIVLNRSQYLQICKATFVPSVPLGVSVHSGITTECGYTSNIWPHPITNVWNDLILLGSDKAAIIHTYFIHESRETQMYFPVWAAVSSCRKDDMFAELPAEPEHHGQMWQKEEENFGS